MKAYAGTAAKQEGKKYGRRMGDESDLWCQLESLRNAGEALAFTVERVLRRDTLAGQRRTLRESLDRWAEALDEEEE